MLASALGLGAALTWSAVLTLPDGRLHVTFLDVERGQAVLVQTPSGEFVLIGGGPSGAMLAEGLGRWMPYWQRRLALAVVTGADDEAARGLAAVLPRYDVPQALVPGEPRETAAYRELAAGLNRRGARIIQAEAGQAFDLGDGARLEVLFVAEAGIVTRVAWGNASFLLPLGEADEQLAALGRDAPAVRLYSSVLFVPGDGTLDRRLIEAISPWAAVLSADSAGPPDETVAALAGFTVLRTDENGWVSFATDGQQLWAETER
jgi:beta-lactamase superfamily II metal-dependent hydrolase